MYVCMYACYVYMCMYVCICESTNRDGENHAQFREAYQHRVKIEKSCMYVCMYVCMYRMYVCIFLRMEVRQGTTSIRVVQLDKSAAIMYVCMYVCNYTFALTVYVCMLYVCILMPGNFCLVALLYWSFNSTHMFIDAGAGEQDIEKHVCIL